MRCGAPICFGAIHIRVANHVLADLSLEMVFAFRCVGFFRPSPNISLGVVETLACKKREFSGVRQKVYPTAVNASMDSVLVQMALSTGTIFHSGSSCRWRGLRTRTRFSRWVVSVRISSCAVTVTRGYGTDH